METFILETKTRWTEKGYKEIFYYAKMCILYG